MRTIVFCRFYAYKCNPVNFARCCMVTSSTSRQARQQFQRGEQMQAKVHKVKVPEAIGEDIGPEEIKKEQSLDPTLEKLRRLVDENLVSGKVRFLYKRGLLYRSYLSDRDTRLIEVPL